MHARTRGRCRTISTESLTAVVTFRRQSQSWEVKYRHGRRLLGVHRLPLPRACEKAVRGLALGHMHDIENKVRAAVQATIAA